MQAPHSDAYAVGYRVANVARDLFAEGALSSAFVPTFTRYLTTKTREEARDLSNITGTLLIAITAGAFCAIGMLFSGGIVEIFAPGFHAVPGKFELATRMVRTMFPFLLLVAMAAQAQGILFACRQFGVPAFSSSLFNVGSVVFGLSLSATGWGLASASARFRGWRMEFCLAEPPSFCFNYQACGEPVSHGNLSGICSTRACVTFCV